MQGHEENLQHGDAFRHMRRAVLAGQSGEADFARCQLTKELRELISRLYQHNEALGHAFDNLIPFDLWKPFEVGSLRRILYLRCEEVRDILSMERQS